MINAIEEFIEILIIPVLKALQATDVLVIFLIAAITFIIKTFN